MMPEMEIYSFTIKLIDPLFYSNEALSGAYTPGYLHATAINHAVTWTMGKPREDQSFVISDAKGGRNVPRYDHSWIEPDFYFTPASIDGDLEYMVETVKGDMDYLIQPGFGQAKIMGENIGRNEVLKAYRLFSIPPETEFNGYLHTDIDVVEKMPRCIRLGSFRGKAELTIGKQIKALGVFSNQYVDHPVDPLVSKVKRGVMIGMFPYPIIDGAVVDNVYEIRKRGQSAFVAIPSRSVCYDKDVMLQRLRELKPGLVKVKDASLSLKDRAYLILHMLRTSLSVRLYIQGIHGEDRLENALKEIDEIEDIRLASRGEEVSIDDIQFSVFHAKIEGIIDECEEKITGNSTGKKSKSSGSRPSSIIL